MSLFQRLLLIITLAILPAIVIQVSNEIALRRERITEAKSVALRLAYQLDDEMGHTIASARQLLADVARMPSVVEEDGPQCTAALQALRDARPAYARFSVSGPDGRIFCSTASVTENRMRQPYVRNVLKRDHFTVDGYTLDEVSGLPAMHFSVPFYAARGGRGVAVAVLTLEQLKSSLPARALPRGSSFVVADSAAPSSPPARRTVPGSARRFPMP